MIISAIVAMSRNRVIGHDNKIPWYLPADLKFFKKTTLNHHVIMGRQTFLSIGRPLPNRTNIVVTRNPFFLADGVLIAHSLQEALRIAQQDGEKEVFIIGGGQLYTQSMPYLDKIYLTKVESDSPGDTFFPEILPEIWKRTSKVDYPADERHEFSYSMQIFERILPLEEEE